MFFLSFNSSDKVGDGGQREAMQRVPTAPYSSQSLAVCGEDVGSHDSPTELIQSVICVLK